jgi:hypothetical protein
VEVNAAFVDPDSGAIDTASSEQCPDCASYQVGLILTRRLIQPDGLAAAFLVCVWFSAESHRPPT